MSSIVKTPLVLVSCWATLLWAHQMPTFDSMPESAVNSSTLDLNEDDAAILRTFTTTTTTTTLTTTETDAEATQTQISFSEITMPYELIDTDGDTSRLVMFDDVLHWQLPDGAGGWTTHEHGSSGQCTFTSSTRRLAMGEVGELSATLREQDIDEFLRHVVTPETSEFDGEPILVPLRRDVVPIRRQGRIVTFKTSYSGVVSLGVPAQDFRVVFDTGSGHVVVPSSKCKMEACLTHKTYNLGESDTGVAIEHTGAVLQPGKLSKEVTIGFGTGVIKAQFARDHVCLDQASNRSHRRKGCLKMHVLMALEMSDSPFTSFLFDGIVGLGLPSLALSRKFSFFDMMSKSGQVAASQFGVFLTEGENGEESELAFGGINPARTLESLSWSPVVIPEHGHWLVDIKAVRVNGEALDICKDGSCRGVVDTGTSHIGVPIKQEQALAEMLSLDAADYLDCRLMDGPTLEIELDSVNLTLTAENYMRRMPLREGVDVGSHVVVSTDLQKAAGNVTKIETNVDENATNATRLCSPRLMPVDMPAPLGPHLWILGEPALVKYYTVYDWGKLQIGFSLANSRRNTLGLEGRGGKGSLPAEVVAEEGHLLAQREASLDEDAVA